MSHETEKALCVMCGVQVPDEEAVEVPAGKGDRPGPYCLDCFRKVEAKYVVTIPVVRARAEWEAGEPEREAARKRAETRQEYARGRALLDLDRAENLLAKNLRNHMAGRVKWSSVRWYRENPTSGDAIKDMAAVRLGHRENDVMDIQAYVEALRAVRYKRAKLKRNA